MKIFNMVVLILLGTPLFAQQDSLQTNPKGHPIIEVFGNTNYNLSADAGQQLRFAIGRAHIGYQYRFDHRFSCKVILDRGRPTTIDKMRVSDSLGNFYDVTSSVKEGSFYTMTLKFANLVWQVNEKLRIEGGGILQNHYITQERFWKYRFVAQTFQDRYFHIPSGDLGFIAYYKINHLLGFDFALTNGEGFRVDQDAFGNIKLAGGIDLYPLKNLQVRLYYHHKSYNDTMAALQEQLFSFFTGYQLGEKARIGFEYNYMMDFDGIPGMDSYGFSIFGDILLSKGFSFFGRLDELKFKLPPNEKNQSLQKDTYALITGFNYNPIHDVGISVNYKGLFSKNKTSTQTNIIALDLMYRL